MSDFSSFCKEFKWVGDELVNAWQDWRDFCEIYDDSIEGRFETLNRFPSFFNRQGRMYFREAVLSICRLLDNDKFYTKNVRRKNLSLLRLINHPEAYEHLFKYDWEFKRELNRKRKRIERKAKSLRLWRNRLISHNDLGSILLDDRLPDIERQKIEDLFGYIKDFLNLINDALNESYTAYDQLIIPEAGAKQMMEMLSQGVDMWVPPKPM